MISRTPVQIIGVRTRGMRGLGALDPNSQMVAGAQYVFHFSWWGLGLNPGTDNISQQIATDSNFANPVAYVTSNGVDVYFQYAGQGSTIQAAGAEMQNVANAWTVFGIGNGINFVSADGGAMAGAPQQTPINAPPQNPPGGISNAVLITGLVVGGVVWLGKLIFG